jgi:hypothetical protein
MPNCNALSESALNPLTPPETDLSALPAKLSRKLWVNPTEFLVVTHALVMAEWALQLSQRLRPSLPRPTCRGPKTVYLDRSIMLLALIQVAWQMGYEESVDYFRAHPEAAQAAGFPDGRVISVGQYWERRRNLGLLPFWFLFIGMVWQLTRKGIIQGRDLILDATTQKAWFHEDSEAAWSFPKPWKGSVWGYKVHTCLCRWSALPVMFLVTPANAQESVFAIPLLVLAVAFFGFPIVVVRADAGYFTYPILNFIRVVLHAGFVIDYNLRRRGKRFLATHFFLWQWRFHQKPRTTIERHFAWAKRYFGLEAGRWAGLVGAYQHTALIYCTMLGVALVAHRYQRPDLAGSRAQVLEAKSIA